MANNSNSIGGDEDILSPSPASRNPINNSHSTSSVTTNSLRTDSRGRVVRDRRGPLTDTANGRYEDMSGPTHNRKRSPVLAENNQYSDRDSTNNRRRDTNHNFRAGASGSRGNDNNSRDNNNIGQTRGRADSRMKNAENSTYRRGGSQDSMNSAGVNPTGRGRVNSLYDPNRSQDKSQNPGDTNSSGNNLFSGAQQSKPKIQLKKRSIITSLAKLTNTDIN